MNTNEEFSVGISSSVFFYGEKPGNSQVAKLVNNMILGITMDAVTEGAKLAAHYSLPQDALFHLLLGQRRDRRRELVPRRRAHVSDWGREVASLAAWNRGAMERPHACDPSLTLLRDTAKD